RDGADRDASRRHATPKDPNDISIKDRPFTHSCIKNRLQVRERSRILPIKFTTKIGCQLPANKGWGTRGIPELAKSDLPVAVIIVGQTPGGSQILSVDPEPPTRVSLDQTSGLRWRDYGNVA